MTGPWTRLRNLFDELVGLGDAGRRERLGEIGARDPALRARLEALLAADDAADSEVRSRAEAVVRSVVAGHAARMSADPLRLLGTTIGHYRVDALVGSGGMGVVYRATDLRLDRPVALKLLPPRWNVDAGATRRFLHEARAAASLDHPNVCTIHEAGETADGSLYIAMPFYEGETLEARLERGAVEVQEALGLALQVACALGAAHARGLVHRDIKPANLLVMPDGTLKVLDFGVAKAADASLTMPNQTPGTAAYMAPEQARGDAVDGRADMWSLGVVLYELLAGSRPAQAAAHGGPVPAPPSSQRSGIPASLDALVLRLLASDPRDRPGSAGEVVRALEAEGAPPWLGRSTSRPGGDGGVRSTRWTRPGRRWTRRSAHRGRWVAAAAVAVLAPTWLALRGREPAAPPELDVGVIVVAPLRVGGADPSVAFLREAMVDLLATRLTGEVGPRALDPRTTLSAWRMLAGDVDRDLPADSALLVARALGAGQLLLAEAVGTAERLTVAAHLVDASTGASGPRATVTGPADSFLELADELAAGLLSLAAGEFDERLDQLTSTSLPALRAYLEAQALSRRGRWEQAVQRYEDALRFDSIFALAGIGLANATPWFSPPPGTRARGVRLAWAARDRLSESDRAYLVALAGPNYPDSTPVAQRLAEWERLAALYRDRADVWHQLADELMHRGLLIEATDALPRAVAAFEHAFSLDPTHSGPLLHLVDLPLYLGDLETAQHYLSLLLQIDPGARWSPVLAWAVPAAAGDSVTVEAFRERLEDMETTTLRGMGLEASMAAAGLADVERALRIALRRARTIDERRSVLDALRILALRRGRPGEALQLADEVHRLHADRQGYLQDRILDALFGDGDTLAASVAAAELETWPWPPSTGAAADWSELSPRCALEQWKLWRGDTSTAAEAVALMAAPPDGAEPTASRRLRTTCAHILEALHAHVEGRPDAGDRVDALDALLRAAPSVGQNWLHVGNVTTSRLLEERGEHERALRAIRRRYLPVSGRYYVPTLLAEGDLAARTGDREGAAVAYRRYLGFRADAEPTLQPLVARVREELSRLVTD